MSGQSAEGDFDYSQTGLLIPKQFGDWVSEGKTATYAERTFTARQEAWAKVRLGLRW